VGGDDDPWWNLLAIQGAYAYVFIAEWKSERLEIFFAYGGCHTSDMFFSLSLAVSLFPSVRSSE
jgi:hypothetical protein